MVDGAVREMKGWPFGAALWREASNHLMLRWLKTVVVSDEEKASVRRQAGTGKAGVSESLLTCRNPEATSEPGCFGYSGMSLADIRLPARWCPACRRREPGLRLPCGTGEGVPGYALVVRPGERECPKRPHRKGLSTVAGLARSVVVRGRGPRP